MPFRGLLISFFFLSTLQCALPGLLPCLWLCDEDQTLAWNVIWRFCTSPPRQCLLFDDIRLRRSQNLRKLLREGSDALLASIKESKGFLMGYTGTEDEKRHTYIYHIICWFVPELHPAGDIADATHSRITFYHGKIILKADATVAMASQTIYPLPPEDCNIKGSLVCIAGWLDVRLEKKFAICQWRGPGKYVWKLKKKQSIHHDSWAGLHAFAPPSNSLSYSSHHSLQN